MIPRAIVHAFFVTVVIAPFAVRSAHAQGCTEGSRTTVTGKIISVKPAELGVLPALSIEGMACGEPYYIELIVEGSLGPNCQRGRNARATGIINLEDEPDLMITAPTVSCW